MDPATTPGGPVPSRSDPGEGVLSTLEDPSATHADPEAVLVGEEQIEGRSLTQIAWARLRRDKVALAGGFFIIILILVAIFAPLIVKITGGPPNEWHEDLLDMNIGGIPIGTFGGMSWQHPMGLETVHGRDIFSRVIYGARISLLIAIAATARVGRPSAPSSASPPGSSAAGSMRSSAA